MERMEKGFIVELPLNEVIVSCVVLDVQTLETYEDCEDNSIEFARVTFYAQNRVFLVMEEVVNGEHSTFCDYHVIIDYCIIPEMDELLKACEKDEESH